MRSRLTALERRIRQRRAIDLGAGYPDIRLPEKLAEVVRYTAAEAASWSTAVGAAGSRSHELTERVVTGMLELLGLPPELGSSSFVTFSGSVAIDRVITAISGSRSGWLVVSPIFDVVPALLSERQGLRVRFLNPLLADGTWDTGRLLAEVRASRPETLLLTSPNNPNGSTLTTHDLAALAEACRAADTVLVVDQCFATINPFGYDIGLLPRVSPEGTSWVFLWDTAKTFGLDDDKLGFIVTSPDLTESVRAAVEVIQIDVSARLKLLFAELFRAARSSCYDRHLADLVAGNWHLCRSLTRVDLPLLRPAAGSFVLLDLSEIGVPAVEACRRLLREARVGVVDAGHFLFRDPHRESHVDRWRDRYIRLALARERTTMEDALARFGILRHASTLQRSGEG